MDTWLRAQPLEVQENNVFTVHAYRFIEHRVTLQDSLMQMWSEPTSFELLNLDSDYLEVKYPERKNYLALFRFGLSQEVKIERR